MPRPALWEGGGGIRGHLCEHRALDDRLCTGARPPGPSFPLHVPGVKPERNVGHDPILPIGADKRVAHISSTVPALTCSPEKAEAGHLPGWRLTALGLSLSLIGNTNQGFHFFPQLHPRDQDTKITTPRGGASSLLLRRPSPFLSAHLQRSRL